MKHVKSLVALAFAAFLCATASASLVVDGDENNKIRTATRAVVVGETVTVPLYNTKNATYANPSAAELTAGDGGTNATSQAYFSVVVPRNVNQTVQYVEITGLQATPNPMTFKIWKDAQHGDTPVEITVKVVAPVESYVGGVKVTSVGATAKQMEDGDLLLTFTETGSFSLNGDVEMRRVLLVGGGAAGNNARNTGDYIYGRSGSGAQAYTNSTFIAVPAGSYDVTVGAGALLSYKYEGNEWVLKSSGGVASTITNTTNNGFVTLTAEGGKSAEGWSGTAGIAGEGGTNMWCDITGVMTLYGVDAPEATSSYYGVAGDANTGAGGVGGYNGDGESGGGAGGSGIVVIRLKRIAQPVSVTVNQPLTYNGLIQTGVVENAGYTLEGVSVATNATTYSVTATLKPGYYWENGSQEAATNIIWSIAPAPVTVSAVNYEKVYGMADPEPLPATIVGTNGFDGAVINYEISREPGETVNTYEITIKGAPADQGNYKVTVVEPTKATFTINWADPYPLVLEGGAVTVKVTRVWLERDEFRQNVLDPEQLRAKLQEKCFGDDFPMWQKYLINIDTNAQYYVAAPENFDPDTVSIFPVGIKDKSLAEPVDEAISGVKVQFRLDEGLGEDRSVVVPAQDETTLKVSLAGNPNSSNYMAYVIFTQNGYKYELPFRNYIGILKSEPYTTSGGAREFVAVPWNRYDGVADGLAVTNIVKTALLSKGDKLYYRTSNTAFGYCAWELDADKKWQPINAVGYGPNGCWSNQVNTISSTKTIKLGGALWLDRKDASTGVVFVGGGRTRGKPATTTNTYVYACSPLGLTELDVKTLDCRKGARVIIPTPGAPIIWTHDGTKWSSEEQYVDSNGIVRTREREDSKIKPGRGYWLDRTKEVPPEN